MANEVGWLGAVGLGLAGIVSCLAGAKEVSSRNLCEWGYMGNGRETKS